MRDVIELLTLSIFGAYLLWDEHEMERNNPTSKSIIRIIKDNGEYAVFDDEIDFDIHLESFAKQKGIYLEDIDENPEAEIVSPNDVDNYWYDSDGNLYLIRRETAKLTLGNLIEQSLTEYSQENGIRFSKSSNNSWYHKNSTDNYEVRVADHPPLYPSEFLTRHDIIITSEDDLIDLHDRLDDIFY